MNHDITEKLGELEQFVDTEAGYDRLKQRLIQLSELKNQTNKQPIEELLNRAQKTGESIEQYGNVISSLGRGIFQKENELQLIFIRGLKDPLVRQITSHKFFKTRDIPNKCMNFEATVRYAANTEMANSYSSTNHEISNISSDSEPMRWKQNYQTPRVRFQQGTGNNGVYNHNNRHTNGGNYNQNGRQPMNNNAEVKAINAIFDLKKRKHHSLVGKIGLENILVEYLFDTGAEVTAISEDLFYRLNLTSNVELDQHERLKIGLCNSTTVESLGNAIIP